MENLKFVAVCLLIFAGLFLVAWLLEKKLSKNRKTLSDTHYITDLHRVASAIIRFGMSA